MRLHKKPRKGWRIIHFIPSLFTTIQQHLFPFQEEALEELSEKHKELIGLAELAVIEKFMRPFGG